MWSNGVEILILKKSSSGRASPPDPCIHEMLELHYFAQLAIQSGYFQTKKILTSKPFPISKILVVHLFMGLLGSRNVDQLDYLFRFSKDQLFLFF